MRARRSGEATQNQTLSFLCSSVAALRHRTGAPFFFVFGTGACYTGCHAGAGCKFRLSWLKRSQAGSGFEETMAGKKKPLVVITRKLPDPVETRMRELFDARLNVDDRPMTQPELVAAMKEADVLVPTITDRIDAALIAQAGANLKLIANFGNGVDKIDVAAATRSGITVTNTPNVLTEDTADMTMALMLDRAAPADRGRQHSGTAGQMGRLVADLDARPPHLGQAPRHRRHGPHRHGGGPARQGLRPVDPLPQPPPRAASRRGRAGGDLLGKPRPDAGPHGHHLGQLPLDAGDLPSAVGAPAGAACSPQPTSSTRRAATSSTRMR